MQVHVWRFCTLGTIEDLGFSKRQPWGPLGRHVGRWQEEITKQHQKEIYESSQSFAMAQLEEGKGWKWQVMRLSGIVMVYYDVCDLYRLVCYFCFIMIY